MDVQQIIIGILVLGSLLYMGRKLMGTVSGKSGCSSCKGGCSHSSDEKKDDSSHHCCSK